MIFSLAACDNQSNNGANSENKEDYMILKTEYNGANVDTVAEQYLDYVKTSESSKEAEILTEYTGTAMAQNFTISWESDGSSQYAVYLADNERFENKKVYLTTREICNLGGTLIPGTTYCYIVGADPKYSGEFFGLSALIVSLEKPSILADISAGKPVVADT